MGLGLLRGIKGDVSGFKLENVRDFWLLIFEWNPAVPQFPENFAAVRHFACQPFWL